MIIGIDIGSTTTKAVSIEDGRLVRKIKTKAPDSVTSATGAFGKMILEHEIKMEDIEGIMITGAGASKIKTIFSVSPRCGSTRSGPSVSEEFFFPGGTISSSPISAPEPRSLRQNREASLT